MAIDAATVATLAIEPATSVIRASADGIGLRGPLDAGSVRALRDAVRD